MLNRVQLDLLKKHVGPFLFCFFTVMFVLLMQFLMLHVENLVGKGLPFGVILELIVTNLAYMVVLAVPMAVLVSTLIAFGKFSEWNELTAVRAAGINPFKLVLPVLVAGGFLFVLTAYFSNYILPEANHKARSLFIDIRLTKPGFDLQENAFYDGIEGYTFLVKEIDADTDTLHDVTVFQDRTQTRNRAYIRADRGWLESVDEQTLTLTLYDGSITRYLPGSQRARENSELSFFTRYRLSFDLSELQFSRANPESRSRNSRTMSAQAMQTVIDTMRTEKENEYRSMVERLEQETVLPFKLSQTSLFRGRTTMADSLDPLESRYDILQILENPREQIRVLSNAVSVINRYQADIETYKSNTQWREFRVAEYLVEIHKKLSIPFACLLFVMIGAPIGMLTKKGNLGVAAIISIGILTVYFIAIIQGEKWADRMIISPFLGMWGINIIMFVIGLSMMIHVCTSKRITNLLISDSDE
ncbi:MAG: LptF/LptG family permease [Balneolaceae bacterium]